MIHPKTAHKRRHRTELEDRKMGSKNPYSTVLSHEQETFIAAFRLHALLERRSIGRLPKLD